ncbi:MAG: helix-turn-helix domain-containing protein [Opitutaceae bacterium]|nr:helix-turn-helix domain-containing protein [Opitutaceae bacterium]
MNAPDYITLEDVIRMSLADGLGIQAGAASALAESILKNAAAMGLGGTSYYLSAVHASQRADRNAAIIAEYRAGKSVTWISREYGVSRCTVWRIVRNVA